MADRMYIASRYSADHVAWITAALARAGFAPSGACVWDSVGAFVATLEPGDRVVVHSLGVFDGSVELFCALRAIFSAGATIYSLRQDALSQKLTQPLIEALYSASIDGLLGLQAEAFSKVDPSVVERLARMDRLVRAGVSVSEASRQSGCTRNVYYYYKRIQTEELVVSIPMPSMRRAKASLVSYPVQTQLPL